MLHKVLILFADQVEFGENQSLSFLNTWKFFPIGMGQDGVNQQFATNDKAAIILGNS